MTTTEPDAGTPDWFVQEAERDVISRVNRAVGYVPIGFKDILHILSSPDVIEYTNEYVSCVMERNRLEKEKKG